MSVGAVPQPGEIVAGKYEIVRFLGKGGMGLVLEARHTKLGHRVALKLLLAEFMDRPDALARFEREARAAALLRSPHVVRVLDVDNDNARGGVPFIVMDYLEGRDLASELKRRQILPVAEAVDLMLQACIAFAEAHASGIVHRDIKPSNLFLEDAQGRPVLKVMDFGVAKLATVPGETELTTTETALGTPSYMAPEQLTSSKTIDHRADIWALGVVTYRMLSGKLPFTADSPAALAVSILTTTPTHLSTAAPAVPPALANAVMSALERDVSRRPQDAIAFGRLLAPFGTGTVPFESSVAGIPVPAARRSDPNIPIAPTQPDVEPTANAWSQRGVAAQPATHPTNRSMITGVVIGVGVALSAVMGLIVFTMTRPSKPPAATTTAPPNMSESSSAVGPATSGNLPATPSTGGPAEPDPPAPVASASAAVRPPPRLGAVPARSAQPKPAAGPSAAPVPTKDPLHL